MGSEIRPYPIHFFVGKLVWLIECTQLNYFNAYFPELNSLMRVHNTVTGFIMESFQNLKKGYLWKSSLFCQWKIRFDIISLPKIVL